MNHFQKTEQSTYWLLSKFAIRSRHEFARFAEQEFGLTWGQLYTLCCINPDAPAAMNTVAEKMSCDASNVTGIVDKLVNQSFIIRQDNPHDRRLKLLVLTRKGRKILKQILQAASRHEPAGLQKLSLADKHMLRELLLKIVEPDSDHSE